MGARGFFVVVVALTGYSACTSRVASSGGAGGGSGGERTGNGGVAGYTQANAGGAGTPASLGHASGGSSESTGAGGAGPSGGESGSTGSGGLGFGGGSGGQSGGGGGSGTSSAGAAGTAPSAGGRGGGTGAGGTAGAAGGTGGGAGGSNSAGTSLSTSDPNVVAITVDSGPATVSYIDGAFASVTLCQPGTTTCQTIDHLLIDTGSTGVRVLESLVTLSLPAATSSSGGNLAECLPFLSGSSWGSVRMADVKIGGETASNMRIQLIGESTYALPNSCTGSPDNDLSTLQSNGILGIGLTAQDCGSACAATGRNNPGLYYACTSKQSCTTVGVSTADQVANPIASFANDNNGSFIQLPAIPAGGAPSVPGFLVFGIGTRSNNALGSANIIPVDNNGFCTTSYSGTSYGSFLDSGSNAYYFLDSTSSNIPTCTRGDWQGFYCPTTSTPFNASILNKSGSPVAVTLMLANPSTFSLQDSAFDDLGGPLDTGGQAQGLNASFDWGLPFFFGRTVFTAIEGKDTPGGTGPYFAF